MHVAGGTHSGSVITAVRATGSCSNASSFEAGHPPVPCPPDVKNAAKPSVVTVAYYSRCARTVLSKCHAKRSERASTWQAVQKMQESHTGASIVEVNRKEITTLEEFTRAKANALG